VALFDLFTRRTREQTATRHILRIVDRLAREKGEHGAIRVLDAESGEGHMARQLAALGCRVDRCDLDPVDEEVIPCDLERPLPFPDRT